MPQEIGTMTSDGSSPPFVPPESPPDYQISNRGLAPVIWRLPQNENALKVS